MDVARMRRNFAKAAAAGDEAPLFFYSHLFLSHPQTRDLFPVSMMHQRDRLFRALGQVVALVDDLDALVPVLQGLGRDHRKFGTVAAHYPAVGASLLATLEHFDDEWDAALAADWAAAYGIVAQVMVEAAEEASSAPAWWEADVLSCERRTIDVTVLQLRPRVELPFRAGQSISVETALRPRLWRYYAVANAPRPDGVLELHVQAHDGGPVSSALARQVAPGDVLRLGPPIGTSTLPPGSDRDLLLVADGTGLAPLKALLDEVARQGPVRRVDLFLGARTEAELYDLPALHDLREKHPWLTVTAVVSDDDRAGSAEQGELTDVLTTRGPWTSREVFVAGSGPVVRQVGSALAAQGLPPERLHVEAFSPSRPGPTVEGKVSA
ncbi:oxidoreductase [Kineococcus sp. T13]|uniref:globin domain-containing protein n=1 Tax=Kineococcus vitellinus TaxID=2696565 RepID=UPI001412B4B5|nr:oxidoreductase [Kineococcus vitellinus]